MTPPTWLDTTGNLLPTCPCQTCGVEVPITETIVPDGAKALGWTPGGTVRLVQWGGHGEELLPLPWGLLPVLD
jgi:hypothetical protein